MAISQELSSSKAGLTVMQSRLASGDTNLATDPSDPDLQSLATLKEKLLTAQTAVEAVKNSLGANNPKMVAEAANIASLKKQIADATDKMREHLKARIAQTQDQIAKLEVSQAAAQKALDRRAVATQPSRRIGTRRRLPARAAQPQERMAAQARLQSKLTFADIAVLDKAAPPIEPAFPKPMIVIPVAIAAGLALGLVLAMLAEMTDRRVRIPNDLNFACSAPIWA